MSESSYEEIDADMKEEEEEEEEEVAQDRHRKVELELPEELLKPNNNVDHREPAEMVASSYSQALRSNSDAASWSLVCDQAEATPKQPFNGADSSYTLQRSTSAGSSILSGFDILDIGGFSVRRCHLDGYMNQDNATFCEGCGATLVANPCMDVDRQIALQLQRKEEEESFRKVQQDEKKRKQICQTTPFEQAQTLAKQVESCLERVKTHHNNNNAEGKAWYQVASHANLVIGASRFLQCAHERLNSLESEPIYLGFSCCLNKPDVVHELEKGDSLDNLMVFETPQDALSYWNDYEPSFVVCEELNHEDLHCSSVGAAPSMDQDPAVIFIVAVAPGNRDGHSKFFEDGIKLYHASKACLPLARCLASQASSFDMAHLFFGLEQVCLDFFGDALQMGDPAGKNEKTEDIGSCLPKATKCSTSEETQLTQADFETEFSGLTLQQNHTGATSCGDGVNRAPVVGSVQSNAATASLQLPVPSLSELPLPVPSAPAMSNVSTVGEHESCLSGPSEGTYYSVSHIVNSRLPEINENVVEDWYEEGGSLSESTLPSNTNERSRTGTLDEDTHCSVSHIVNSRLPEINENVVQDWYEEGGNLSERTLLPSNTNERSRTGTLDEDAYCSAYTSEPGVRLRPFQQPRSDPSTPMQRAKTTDPLEGLISGDAIFFTGGFYKGKLGVYVERRAKRIRVRIPGSETERFVSPENVRPVGHPSCTSTTSCDGGVSPVVRKNRGMEALWQSPRKQPDQCVLGSGSEDGEKPPTKEPSRGDPTPEALPTKAMPALIKGESPDAGPYQQPLETGLDDVSMNDIRDEIWYNHHGYIKWERLMKIYDVETKNPTYSKFKYVCERLCETKGQSGRNPLMVLRLAHRPPVKLLKSSSIKKTPVDGQGLPTTIRCEIYFNHKGLISMRLLMQIFGINSTTPEDHKLEFFKAVEEVCCVRGTDAVLGRIMVLKPVYGMLGNDETPEGSY